MGEMIVVLMGGGLLWLLIIYGLLQGVSWIAGFIREALGDIL